MLVARVARDLVRSGFLLERRWAPYGEWPTAAFAQLTLADQIGEHLHHALRATRWRERDAALCAAASHLAAATNRPGLAEPVDPARAFLVDRVGIDPADGTSEARTGSSQSRWPAHHPAAEWHHTTSTAEGIRSCG